MSGIRVRDLGEDHAFGAIVEGIDYASLENEGVRAQIKEVFERRGMIVFDGVEASSKMHVAISDVFGPLKEHPVPVIDRVDGDTMPGVIDMRYDPDEGTIVEFAGKQLATWAPWHFDHCYNNELNRAGVLRAVTIPPEGGQTLFADGIELYRDLPDDLKRRIDGVNVIYTLDLLFDHMRFGKPAGLRELRVSEGARASTAYAKELPRALHPAVWTRADGEKVFHVSPWMAAGIEGHEDPEGDALLEEVCREIEARVRPYSHSWKPDQMVIWDNWRMLHAVSGMDPVHPRRMQRTTIKGDYGLGSFENQGTGDKILEMTV